jgi:hypothetical protein
LLKIAGGALALLALAVLVVKWRVATVLDEAIAQAAPIATITRGSSFVGLDGTIGVTQVAITPLAREIGTVRFARLSLHTPGLGWILRQALPGKSDALPERFGMSIDGLDTSLVDLDADTPSLVGTHSGAPFEQAGCQDSTFSEADLASFGLPREPTRIEARYAIADGVLRIESSAARAGSAATRVVLRLRLAGNARPDPAGLLAATFEGIDLEMRDEGFMAARNKACAEITSQPVDAFLAAHLARAQRLARAVGIAPDAAAWAAYAGFARDGGELVFNGTLRRPVPLAALAQAAGPNGLLLDWSARRDGGALQRVALEAINPEPLAAGPRTLAQQVQAELEADRVRQEALRAGNDPGTAPDPDAASGVAAPDAAASVPAPASAAAAAPAAPAATLPAAPSGAGARTAAGGWIEASYESLNGASGIELRVETIHGSRRQGTLENWNPAGMVLRLDARDGGIPLSLSPRDLRRIERRNTGDSGAP